MRRAVLILRIRMIADIIVLFAMLAAAFLLRHPLSGEHRSLTGIGGLLVCACLWFDCVRTWQRLYKSADSN